MTLESGTATVALAAANFANAMRSPDPTALSVVVSISRYSARIPLPSCMHTSDPIMFADRVRCKSILHDDALQPQYAERWRHGDARSKLITHFEPVADQSECATQ